jgi:hypothetical protein
MGLRSRAAFDPAEILPSMYAFVGDPTGIERVSIAEAGSIKVQPMNALIYSSSP